MSDDVWNFKTDDNTTNFYTPIYIENISKMKVLEYTNDGDLILEDFRKDKAEQVWNKGEPNAEGYFILEKYCTWNYRGRNYSIGGCLNSEVPKVMTAISLSSLKTKGNIALTSYLSALDF